MAADRQVLRWGIERRMEFVEFRLFWNGKVNRSEISSQFGVSSQQASADLARYQEIAPGNVRYDRAARSYVATEAFAPAFYRGDSESYLSQLRLASEGIMREEELWPSPVPAFDTVPTPRRQVDPDVLRGVTRAIASCSRIEALYQSMSRPEPTWRWITPHALAFDGHRWHARALCHIDMRFKDFLLPRISAIRAVEPYPMDPALDREWQTAVTLVLGPHPDLTPGQRAAVEADYGMRAGRLEMVTRLAFVYYLRRRLGLDLGPDVRKPSDQHVVLLNADKVDAAFAAAHKGDEA